MKTKTVLLLSAAVLALTACRSQQASDPVVSARPAPAAPAKPPAFDPNAAPVSQTGFPQNTNVQQFIRHQASHGRYSEAELQQFFERAQYKGNIISIMNRPGTSRPWHEFRRGNAGSGKINGGRRFYQQNRQVIDQVAREYGVPAEIIVAIIGIETNYGSNMGSFRLADSLPTLGFDYPRRAEFFQKELGEFLLMAKEEGRDPFSFMGSYAGAMGMPQFMPSSYRKWAVDYDRDGQRNIWGSVPDVAASVANYMKAHGWQTGGRVMVPVSLAETTPQLLALIEEKTALNYTVGQLRQMGVVPLEAVADHEKAVLFRLEVAPERFEYYIGLNNFYSIWQYNHSRLYVSAVRDIANGIGQGGL